MNGYIYLLTRRAGSALLTRVSLRHGDVAAVELITVKLADGRLGCLVIRHLDKAEALATTSNAVSDDAGRRDLAILAEQFVELLLFGAEVQLCYKDVHSLKDRLKKG